MDSINILTSNCMFAVAVLWTAAFGAYALRFWRYDRAADVSMTVILVCFTVLVVKHHVIDEARAHREHADVHLVVRDGDQFYHAPDCERLIGTPDALRPFDPMRDGNTPCLDCVLPRVERWAGQ